MFLFAVVTEYANSFMGRDLIELVLGLCCLKNGVPSNLLILGVWNGITA